MELKLSWYLYYKITLQLAIVYSCEWFAFMILLVKWAVLSCHFWLNQVIWYLKMCTWRVQLIVSWYQMAHKKTRFNNVAYVHVFTNTSLQLLVLPVLPIRLVSFEVLSPMHLRLLLLFSGASNRSTWGRIQCRGGLEGVGLVKIVMQLQR